MPKEYGLIKTKKSKVFDSSSEEDNVPIKKKVKISQGDKSKKKQVEIMQEKALAEDPTVFQYDEVYDDIENKRKEVKEAKKSVDKKPKYIGKLLETADKRKKENERRLEKQVQKEREAEGEEFKDKESFVTSAYRAKLEEMREAEEVEKREDYLESIGDVTKQKDLGGFYRHIYEQKLGDEKQEQEVTKVIAPTPTDSTVSDKKSDTLQKEQKDKKGRKYRRKMSTEQDETTEDTTSKDKKHLQSNLDADSDFEIDSSDSGSEAGDEVKEVAETTSKQQEEVTNGNSAETNGVHAEKEETPERKPKIDIWKKRTVGEQFDSALERYYQRKALRESA